MPGAASGRGRGERQVAVGDDDVLEALAGDIARPASTAPLRPRPGLHRTAAPAPSAHAATSSSSQRRTPAAGGGGDDPVGQPAGQSARCAVSSRPDDPWRRRSASPARARRAAGITVTGAPERHRSGRRPGPSGDGRPTQHRAAVAAPVTTRGVTGVLVDVAGRGHAAGAGRAVGRSADPGVVRGRRRPLAQPGDRALRPPPRLLGAPVFETRVRVPVGGAVQPVWAVPDHGGCTRGRARNGSPLPIGRRLHPSRPAPPAVRPPPSPSRGSIPPARRPPSLPIGHHATATVVLAHDRRAQGPLPTGLPAADAVCPLAGRRVRRGEAGLDLPDSSLTEAVRAARCEALLGASERSTSSEGAGIGRRRGRERGRRGSCSLLGRARSPRGARRARGAATCAGHRDRRRRGRGRSR